MTDEEIKEYLENNPFQDLTVLEEEDESGREWIRCWYDSDSHTYVWEYGTQARASDGGYCMGATHDIYEQEELFPCPFATQQQ